MALGTCPISKAYCNFVPAFETLSPTDRPAFEYCNTDGSLPLMERCVQISLIAVGMMEQIANTAQQTEGDA
jgi:hypothetical protein